MTLFNLQININRVHTQLRLKLTPNTLCGVGVNILPMDISEYLTLPFPLTVSNTLGPLYGSI